MEQSLWSDNYSKNFLLPPMDNSKFCNKETLSCRHCGQIFTSQTVFDEHVLAHQPYACSMCNYRCHLKWDLIKHNRTHTKEKPFACPYCPHKTAQKGNLTYHIKSKHGTSGTYS